MGAIEKIAKQIGKVDKKDSKALMEIARKLATADSTTGLEKDGKDESEDAKALREIAKSLLKLTGLPGDSSGASGSESGASGADDSSSSSGASGSESGASGSESGSSGASGPQSKLMKMHQKVSELEKILGVSGPESDKKDDASGAEGGDKKGDDKKDDDKKDDGKKDDKKKKEDKKEDKKDGASGGEGIILDKKLKNKGESEDSDEKEKWKAPVKAGKGELAPPKLTMQPMDVKTIM